MGPWDEPMDPNGRVWLLMDVSMWLGSRYNVWTQLPQTSSKSNSSCWNAVMSLGGNSPLNEKATVSFQPLLPARWEQGCVKGTFQLS